MTRFAGVIFDMDGVVADTEHYWDQGWTEFAAKYGKDWTHQDTMSLQGLSVGEWSAKLAAMSGVPEKSQEAADYCINLIVTAVREGRAPLLPGARELIAVAAAAVPIGMATSSARPIIDELLAHHGLAEVFAATVSSAEVPRGKPSPDVYLAAARRIGIEGKPGIGIEDSGNGIRAAHAAGLHVIAIPNPQYPPAAAALELADYIAADHADALAYLKIQLDSSN